MKHINIWFWLGAAVLISLAGCRFVPQATQAGSGVVSGKICFPSESIPEMTIYFQPRGEDRAISYPVHEGQQEYSLELAPGTYHAYAWLPGGLLGGGMYSEAVPCGLEADCGHGLLPVNIHSGEETRGVDICDWYASPGSVPLPPGLVGNMIFQHWQEEHPEYSGGVPQDLEELTLDGQLIPQLGVRIFRVEGGPLENETFLIPHGGEVLRLGVADGGQGVSALALSDLDGDGTSELYYSYSSGSGIHQSRLGVYAPAQAAGKVFEAVPYFLGDLGLFSDQPGHVGVRAVEEDPETMTFTSLGTLGTLSLRRVEGQLQLVLDLIEDLPAELRDLIVFPDASEEIAGQLWRTVEDTHHGVRFAVPCFWEVGFRDPPPPTDAYAYPVRNYSERYADSLGKDKTPLWEGGGIKIDMNFLSGSDWNLSPDASPEDLLAALNDSGSGQNMPEVEEVLINGQEGRFVTDKNSFGEEYQYYLFKVSESKFLMFGPRSGTLDHPDVQGILHSLALSPGVDVKVPGIVPAGPPGGGGEAACMQEQ